MADRTTSESSESFEPAVSPESADDAVAAAAVEQAPKRPARRRRATSSVTAPAAAPAVEELRAQEATAEPAEATQSPVETDGPTDEASGPTARMTAKAPSSKRAAGRSSRTTGAARSKATAAQEAAALDEAGGAPTDPDDEAAQPAQDSAATGDAEPQEPAEQEPARRPRRRRKATAASAAPQQAPAAEQPAVAPEPETDAQSPADESGETAVSQDGAQAAEEPQGDEEASQEAPTVEEDDDQGAVEDQGAEDQDAEDAESAEHSEDSPNDSDEEAFRLPAASLLFQAPDPARARRRRRATAATTAPSAAPAARQRPGRSTAEASADQDQDREESSRDADAAADQEAPAGRRPRRRRKAAAAAGAPEVSGEATQDEDLEQADDAGQAQQGGDEESAGGRRKRRRGGRGRRSRGREETPEQSPSKEAAEQDRSQDAQSDDDQASSSRIQVEDEGGSSSRRRRRRSRTRSDAGRDVRDEVTALKGSTRLEAKRQRRREGRAAGRRRPIVTEAEFLARRESVDRQMIVRESDGLNQIAVLEDGLLVEHYVARHTQTSMVGNVYVGRVQNVLPSMEAAFVDLGKGRNAVLYAGEVNWDAAGMEGRPRRIEDALSSGDPVLVQVTKDPIGHKGARLTSQITLAGRFLVLVPGGTMTGISRKLPDTERSRLKKILKRIVPDSAGVIVRTAAEGASEEQLAADVARLVAQWEAIDKKAASVFKGSAKAPMLLKGEPELAVRVVRDVFNEDFRKLVVAGPEAWRTISEYVGELSPDLADRLEHWTGPDDVFAAHRIDEQLAKGFDRKVWLPSGGTLVIDRTEAMTVIDVNTGRFTGAGGTLEETVTRNNIEAAEEIVRQLRLRDIGGMVVIDFVDMVLESNRDLVLRRLVECLGRDRTRHQVTEVTSLGLVQMTRKRVGQGLVEAFSTTCECCKGRGFIVHDEPVENQQADMSASASRGSGRSRGRKRQEEASSEAAPKEKKGKKDKKSARKKDKETKEATSPEAEEEARAAVRGALAQIAAAAEHAHREQEAQDSQVEVQAEARSEGQSEAQAEEAPAD
ncbi:Rne/Rng family ribonuclease [Actinomyces slackii]|uniref:Rne/Rng family ribonuclease n=1 Tax=Actinomyces slackii TaxID=52774 RepID=UPI001E51B7C5|nr:Rne/Rng family ribonuclease [Actinomyces slackii]